MTNEMPSLLDFNSIFEQLDIDAGTIRGENLQERRLSDLKGCFADEAAFHELLQSGDPLLYTVDSVTPADGPGDLHYGIGTLFPGCVGDEYFMTKGHLHSWREAAEIYIGLSGEGGMLLEDEASGETRFVPLKKNSVVYVPGRTAHRTMNTGSEKLVYLGIYPSQAGHDYGAIAENNFKCVVTRTSEGPKVSER